MSDKLPPGAKAPPINDGLKQSTKAPEIIKQAPQRDPRFFRDPVAPPSDRYWVPTEMGWEGIQSYDTIINGIRKRQSFDPEFGNYPNAEFLTPMERSILRTLPRVMDYEIGGKKLGDRLSGFDEGWLGKVFAGLDVLAEGLERSYGFMSQWSDAMYSGKLDEFNEELAEAWYAGSLFADVTNLPHVKIENGITKLTLPDHLSGRNGLNRARQRILELTDSGMAPGEALKVVRAEYYNDLGALSLRAQLQDTYFHFFLDPLNVLTAYIKPVEFAQGLRTLAMTGKYLPGTVDDLARIADKLGDSARLAENLGDMKGAAEYIEAAARVTARADALKTAKPLTKLDQAIIFMTGGDPMNPNAFAKKWNPFSLTPESRMHEMIAIVDNNIGNYILGKFDDPLDISQAIYRAKQGSLGPEFGHAFLTLEGRTAQAVLSSADVAAKKLLTDYLFARPFMRTVDDIAQALGETAYQVIGHLEADDIAPFLQRLIDTGDNGARLASNITDDFINTVKLFNKSDVPYTPQLYKFYLAEEIRDATARLAISKFGIKSKGLILKMTGAAKTAETLAFLRMNPTFAIKNFINNETTTIGRFLAGITSKSAARIIDDIGFTPYRVKQAFTITGEGIERGQDVSKATDAASVFAKSAASGKHQRTIADVLRGDETIFDKIDDWIRSGGEKIPKWLDMGYYATKAEKSASIRAFASGYTQGMNRFWKPGKGFSPIGSVINKEILEGMDAKTVKGIEEALAGIRKASDFDTLKAVDNLNLNARAIADDITRQYGYDLGQRFGAEYLEELTEEIAEALPKGTDATRRVIENAREDAFKKLDEMYEAAHLQRIEEVAATVQIDGPNGILKAWGDSVDDFFGNTVAYDVRMSRLNVDDLTGDLADAFWSRVKKENSAMWKRNWGRMDETLEGIKKGAANLLDADGKPMKIPPQVTAGYDGWKKAWSDFYNAKANLLDEFFGALREKKTPPKQWIDIQAELDDLYIKASDLELSWTTEIDDAITEIVRTSNPDMANAFSAWREVSRNLRRQDKIALMDFRKYVSGIPVENRPAAWRGFWKERQKPHEMMWRTERAALAALQGDRRAMAGITKLDDVTNASGANRIREIARDYKIRTATDKGVPIDSVVVNTVNKYMRGEYGEVAETVVKQFEKIGEIPEDVALRAFEARRIFKDPTSLPPVRNVAKQQEFKTIADSSFVLKDYKATNPPMDIGMDQHWMTYGYQALDDIEEQAIRRIQDVPLRWSDLTPDQMKEVDKYIRIAEGQFADARMASLKWAEFRRDSALLNYNRRYNYNTWLGAVLPFEFWTTQSIAKWALHSIDRPAMLSAYLRMKRFITTAGLPDNGFPSRLRDSIKVEMPFLPEWMGNEFWVDPLQWALPFDNFANPIEQYYKDSLSEKGRTERLLYSMVRDGKITQQQAEDAIENGGDVWNSALAQVRVNDSENKTDAWDYTTMLLAPHAPLTWAKEYMDGTPENIGAFLPISRTFKQAFGVLGVDTSNAKWNVGGNIRRAMGLPAFDKWDDYRIDRELSNMAAEGYNLELIKRAMIDRNGPLYEEAQSRAARAFAGGGAVPFLLKTLGIPTNAYPEGEQKQRALQEEYGRAYEAYTNGDAGALTRFFDDYPEYEARLALWDTPEERLHSFLVDGVWDKYHDLPILHRNQLRDALGDDWERFLSQDRKGSTISSDVLQMWFKLMGGDPPGSLNSPAQDIGLADVDTAWRVEQFYDLRKRMYPDYRDLQNTYFSLDDAAQRKFRAENPELTEYWNWRRDFFHRNPEVVPFLDDDFEFEYKSVEEYKAAQSGLPQYTFNEWKYIVGSESVANVIRRGNIPSGSVEYLENMASKLGLTLDQLIGLIRSSQ